MRFVQKAGFQIFLLMIGVFVSSSAQALLLTHTVDGRDNLYNTAWAGNSYSGAIGTGLDARSVKDSGGIAFDFSGLGTISEVAVGSVVDAGSTATDADGFSSLFRGLPVYSLIGIWSSTWDSITAIDPAFFIGTSAMLMTPSSDPLYLFLAENDGIFSDNSGQYNVSITYSAVPEPTSLTLLALGLIGIGFARSQKN